MHSKRIEHQVKIKGAEITLICTYYPATKTADILGWRPTDEDEELLYREGVEVDRAVKKQRRQLELEVIDYATTIPQ